jgi:lipopolysaccharide/colanic/teichoic acid biosynthesis glycosyltransferase
MNNGVTGRQPCTPSHAVRDRIFDLCLAIILSPLWLPLTFLTGVAITTTYGRPALYVSERIGKGGADFTFWKFRTLDSGGKPLGRLASFLRKTHLDELPQLWNLIRGSMALVGPRPLMREDHLSLGDPSQRESLTPGLTGPWQLERTDKYDYSNLEALDRQLCENRSLWFRMRIVIRTVGFMVRSLK